MFGLEFLYSNGYSYLIKERSQVFMKKCVVVATGNETVFCCIPGMTAPSPAQQKVVEKVSMSCRG